jgi:hypothetical protein
MPRRIEARPGSYGAQLVIPVRLSRDDRARIRDALGAKRLAAVCWSHIEKAAARYRRQKGQDRAARSTAEQRAALSGIATLSGELAGPLAAMDDESSFRLVFAGLDPHEIDMATEIVAKLAQASAAALATIGDTRGAPRRLDSLRVFLMALAPIWRQIKGQRVTLDRVRTDTGYKPITPSATFFEAIISIIDNEVTAQQLGTAIQDIKNYC